MFDSSSIFQVITASLGMFCAFVIIELLVPTNLEHRHWTHIRTATFAILGFSVLAFHFHPNNDGVILDVRGALLVVATFYGGYTIGALTAAAELIVRISIGGPFVLAGTGGIVIIFLFCCLIRYLSDIRNKKDISLTRIAIAGVAAGLIEAFCLLLRGPFDAGYGALVQYGPSIVIIQSVSTLLFGGLFKVQNDRHSAQMNAVKQNEAMQLTLRQSIEALATAMVHRDPTTAGHEKRVAEMTADIGRELGLSENRIEGLQLAALVHDVGQIQIPAEILSRPRELLPQEFELIKHHSQAGYDILKEVNFPWPIAEIVLQHHENHDGTGYPRGLKDEQILLESKIIRVCDSLDAMLSHRPFRRARDFSYALHQLEVSAGTLYDPAVVAACKSVLERNGMSAVRNMKAPA